MSNGEPLSAEELAVVRPALLAGVLCNDAHLRTEDGRPSLVGDPTEGALVVLGAKGAVDPAEVRRASDQGRRGPVRLVVEVHGHAAPAPG